MTIGGLSPTVVYVLDLRGIYVHISYNFALPLCLCVFWSYFSILCPWEYIYIYIYFLSIYNVYHQK